MSAGWILVPALVSLRAEFNALAPGRDKTSDGSIGDQAHAGSSSDHNPDETGNTPTEDADNINEVHAIDVDKDLRRDGWTMERSVQIIVGRHRDGADDRLQNVIYNRRIWSRSWGWTARPYTGANPHDKHAHFSARYTTAAESSTKPWGLRAAAEQEEEDIVDAADRTAIAKEAAALVVAKLGPKIDACVSWGDPAANAVVKSRVFGQVVTDLEMVRAALRFQPGHPEAVGAGYGPGTPLGQLLATPDVLGEIGEALARIEVALTSTAPPSGE